MKTHMKLTLHDLNDGHDIAIINDQLPEVYDIGSGAEASMGSLLLGEYSVCVREDNGQTANWFYRAALCNLAMWKYKTGEDARHDAAITARDKRRDELAQQFAGDGAYAYRFADEPMQAAINKIIELETP